MTIRRFLKSKTLIFALGILVGLVAVVVFRYIAFKDTDVHYHANFALYINGERDPFKSFTFYEEVQACMTDNKVDPKTRVHMHDQNSGLIHVHASGVTWAQFFNNLGYGLTDTMIQTDKGAYMNGQDGKRLSFTLNGKPTGAIANRVIQSEDKLLINYGDDEPSVLEQRFKTVPNDAHEANLKHDPGACSGGHELTTWQRMKKSMME